MVDLKYRPIKLSVREIQVVQLIALEKNSLEIARILCISLDTVKTHRKNIMIKLNTVNVAGVVRRAFEEQLLRIPVEVMSIDWKNTA